MTINKSQINKRLADKLFNLRRNDIDRCVEIILHEIVDSLCRDVAVEIRGVFRLSTKLRKSYISRNPKTGTRVNVPTKRIIKFKASSILLKKLNNGFTDNRISDTY